LALPLFGIDFTLFTLARRVFGAIWRWGKPTSVRRVTGALLSAAIVAGIALLWAPRLPLPGGPAGPLYAATAPFVPIQPNEHLTLAEITTTQGSLANPGVTPAPSVPSDAGTSVEVAEPRSRQPVPGQARQPARARARSPRRPARRLRPRHRVARRRQGARLR
ncbi:MAG: hypothetical protein DMF89_25085, partial [Acidobacteria bacterium]